MTARETATTPAIAAAVFRYLPMSRLLKLLPKALAERLPPAVKDANTPLSAPFTPPCRLRFLANEPEKMDDRPVPLVLNMRLAAPDIFGWTVGVSTAPLLAFTNADCRPSNDGSTCIHAVAMLPFAILFLSVKTQRLVDVFGVHRIQFIILRFGVLPVGWEHAFRLPALAAVWG